VLGQRGPYRLRFANCGLRSIHLAREDWMGAIGEEGVDKPGDAARDPGDDPSTKYQENGAPLVTLALRCHTAKRTPQTT